MVAPLINAVLHCAFRIRVEGTAHIPASGGVLYVANHPSVLDPLALAAVFYRHGRRVRFLALSDLFRFRVRGWALRAARMIPVVRGGGVEAMTRDACAALAAGQAVLVYPEGRASPAGDEPARPGAGAIALRAEVPVVPVTTWGLGPEGGRRLLRRPVGVVIGPPLAVDRARRDGHAERRVAEELLAAVRDANPAARELSQSPRSIP